MIKTELFGKMPDGREVFSYTMENKAGASVKVISLGATLVSINVPNKDGVLADVICGYDDVNFFRKTFKKEIGISPLEYRERFSIV